MAHYIHENRASPLQSVLQQWSSLYCHGYFRSDRCTTERISGAYIPLTSHRRRVRFSPLVCSSTLCRYACAGTGIIFSPESSADVLFSCALFIQWHLAKTLKTLGEGFFHQFSSSIVASAIQPISHRASLWDFLSTYMYVLVACRFLRISVSSAWATSIWLPLSNYRVRTPTSVISIIFAAGLKGWSRYCV